MDEEIATENRATISPPGCHLARLRSLLDRDGENNAGQRAGTLVISVENGKREHVARAATRCRAVRRLQ